MPAPVANPIYANVAFFRIPQWTTLPVSEQALRKDELEGRARAAIARIPESDRAVLDADDGLVLVLFGDPERALDVTEGVRAKGGGTLLHTGLNYGPLALTTRGTDARVFGDGLVSASAAARFSQPGNLLVTQNFAKALEATSPERAAELETAGEFTDTRVRLHSFFTPDARRAKARVRRLLAIAVIGVGAILCLGVIGRETYQRLFPPSPAIVKLQIKPRGEVFVDGVSRGRIPPLTEVQIAPGRHVVQIRHPGQPQLELELNLKAGEQMTIHHTFGRIEQKPKPDFWRDLKRKFGGS